MYVVFVLPATSQSAGAGEKRALADRFASRKGREKRGAVRGGDGSLGKFTLGPDTCTNSIYT